MSNIETFDRSAAHIFSSLYESFPVPIDLDFEKVPENIFEDKDDNPTVFDKLVVYEITILWLKFAGYIHFDAVSYDGVLGVILTPKGLEIMKLPSSIEVPGPSIGEQLRSSRKAGAWQIAAGLTQTAITNGFSLASGSA